MSYIIWPGETIELDQLGGKAGALAALSQQGFSIPAWFVLSPGAFYASLDEAQRALLAGGDESSLTRLFEGLALSEAVQQALYEALARLCPTGEAVAVRSSALDEDGEHHSFAGQLESFLNIPPQAVTRKVVAVWRSGYSERLLAYRRSHGLEAAPRPPAVLIQRMVQPVLSGVAFSADPVTGDRESVVVAAVPGLGAALLSGEIDGDSYRVDRQGYIVDRYPALGNDERRTANGKQPAHGQVGVNGDQKPILNPRSLMSDSQIQRVADLARRVDQVFGGPQDIEWAIEGEQLYLLQARPVTTLGQTLKVSETFRVSDQPEGMLNLWDNSNIAESYPGVTTPLTFSFARRAYEEVYRQFCRMMGVPAQVIGGEASTFRRMLGLRQGQIYYNLLSWYRVLALLPGYKLNRRFMEQMMGVKEPLPDELLDQQAPPSRADRWRDGLYLLRTLLGLLLNYVLLPRRIKAFYARFNQALGSGRPDLSQAQPEALVAYYRDLEDQLLTRWDAPLINDFFAMIFYGLLRKLTESWCGDTQGTLQNSLLTQTGDIISAEPARRIIRLAHHAAVEPDLVTLLCQESLAEISASLPRYPEFSAQYRAYLDKFGERCLEELKLESPTLHDDPLLLLRSIGQLARTGVGEQEGKRNGEIGRWGDGELGNWGVGEQRDVAYQLPITNYQLPATLHQAEQRVRMALDGRPLRRLIFGWVLGNARRLIRNRENLRFERTRLFGRARLIFVELGDRFSRLGLLEEPRDIFYLEVEEALGLVEGVASTADLNGLVAVRKAEFDHYRTLPPLPNRFETRGIPIQRPPRSQMKFGNNENPKSKIRAEGPLWENPKSMRGLGCSPGRVRGPVRVVTDPKAAQLRPGEILVAQRTDPGWILLFPAAAGLLVEYGSLLSHSAIVSRELGLPAVVGLAGLTHWLRDGDWVEFDGSTGLVTQLEPPHS